MKRIRKYWVPFMAYVRSGAARNWAGRAAITAMSLGLAAWFLHDPAWVSCLALGVEVLYFVTWLCLAVGSYRRSLAEPPAGRHQVHTRNDIWKRRWPW